MSKIWFISQWFAPIGHHATQLGEVVDAEFLTFSEALLSASQSSAESPDCVILTTRLISDPGLIFEAVDIIKFLREKNKELKIVLVEIEGFIHYEICHLLAPPTTSSFALPHLVGLMKTADLCVSTSSSAADVMKVIAPDSVVKVFGFIPEPDEMYERIYQEVNAHEDNYGDAITIGIGSKVGAARHGGLDFLAAAEMQRIQKNKEIVVVPLTGGVRVRYYEQLANILNFELEPPEERNYEDFLFRLGFLDVVFNMDPLSGASRLASECARMGVTCVGMEGNMYQKKYFPETCLTSVSPIAAANTAVKFPEIGKSARVRALKDGREAHIREWTAMLRGIGVDV